MSDGDHMALSKDIGKVAAALEGLTGKFEQFEKYAHERNHEILNHMQGRDGQIHVLNNKIDLIVARLDDHGEEITIINGHVENFKALRNKGAGILIAVAVAASALGPILQSVWSAVTK